MERKAVKFGNIAVYTDDMFHPLIAQTMKSAIFTRDADLQKLLNAQEFEIVKLARQIKNLREDIEFQEKQAQQTNDVKALQEVAAMKVDLENLEKEYKDKLFELEPEPLEEEEKTSEKTAIQPKTPMSIGKGMVSSIAKKYGIPDDIANMFFMIIDGQLYIKHPGLLYIASKIGYQRVEVVSAYDEKTKTWNATAKVYPKINTEMIQAIATLPDEFKKQVWEYITLPTVANATANMDNVKNSRMYPFLKEMAETRAINRALRIYTGYGGTSFEELPDSEINEE